MDHNEVLRGLDYVMDWKNHKPDAVRFSCAIADARQWIIDANLRIEQLETAMQAKRGRRGKT